MGVVILWYSSLVCYYEPKTCHISVHPHPPSTLPDQEHQRARSEKDVTPPELAAPLPQSGLRMRARASEAGQPLLAEHKYSKGFTGTWTIPAQRCNLISPELFCIEHTWKVTHGTCSAWPLLCNLGIWLFQQLIPIKPYLHISDCSLRQMLQRITSF